VIEPTNVFSLKMQLHAVNACVKRLSQCSFKDKLKVSIVIVSKCFKNRSKTLTFNKNRSSIIPKPLTVCLVHAKENSDVAYVHTWVNFINVLRTNFSYESALSSFSLVTKPKRN